MARFADESGLTFIELLVVVAIIGILATLAISNFSMFKTNALMATAASDARGLAPGADMKSTEVSATVVIPFGPDGGDVPAIPGGKSSPGTVGTVVIGPNTYTIQAYQAAPNICFTLDNGVMTATPGTCA